MSNLQSSIEKAADAFAREIIDAVKAATLQELLGVREIAVEAPARRRGRPPKAEAEAPKRRGRPPKAAKAKKPVKKAIKKAIKKKAKKAIKAPAKKRRSFNYPKCSVPGCKKNRYARGNGMCGDHFKASKKG
jgi:hypothetical protein